MRGKPYKAFTLVEVAVTIVVVGLIVGSSMTIMDRIIGAMMDMRLRADAFETARQNMELLLSKASVSDVAEYGVSEVHPEIQWQTVIEPFYEPISNAMWVRAICSAGYTDSKGQYQELELEHWLTNLPANVVRQILLQQKMEEEYLDLMSGTASGQEEAAIQETTIAYLTEERLDVDAYTNFLERQRRQKLEYIAKYGFDDDYDTFLEKLREDENAFLERLGADFDKYNEFARAYVPRFSGGDSPLSPVTPDTPSRPGESGRDPASREGGEKPPTERPDTQDQTNRPPPEQKKIWTPDDVRAQYPNIPESLIPVVVGLLNS